jgi:hypothetical protein
LLLGSVSFHVAAIEDLQRAPQLNRGRSAFFFELLHSKSELAELTLVVANDALHRYGRVAFFRPSLGASDFLLKRFEFLYGRA